MRSKFLEEPRRPLGIGIEGLALLMTRKIQTDVARTFHLRAWLIVAMWFLLVRADGAQSTPIGSAVSTRSDASLQNSPQETAWRSPARLRHGILSATSGTFIADPTGLKFVPTTGTSRRWTYTNIKSLDMRRHRIILTGYENRKWHMPKLREFKFALEQEMTPGVAASLAAKVNKPMQNRVPDPNAPATTVIAVRRSDHFGGSNGLLRIRSEGIDYVTAQPHQSRSWRWADLQSLSHPDPYHLLVFGYRDSYGFELKEPLSRDVFNHLSDEIWEHNESDITGGSATVPASAPALGGRSPDE